MFRKAAGYNDTGYDRGPFNEFPYQYLTYQDPTVEQYLTVDKCWEHDTYRMNSKNDIWFRVNIKKYEDYDIEAHSILVKYSEDKSDRWNGPKYEFIHSYPDNEAFDFDGVGDVEHQDD